jgi:SOS response regulatory protein OraA/RecX
VATATVTALRERPRGRVAVELDGTPWRVLPADAVVRAGLGVGRALDRPAARALARELRRADALARAARALKPRDRSRQSLEDRLAGAGVPAATRGEVLETLERVGLVDDARVAASRARHLAQRGFGDEAIRHDLEGEGVAAELVAEAVAELDPERERAKSLAAKRGGDADTARTARWLAGRGFDPSSIEDALGEAALGGFADEA